MYLYNMKVGRYEYVYLIHGYRNEEGKVRQKRKVVGKVDENTGKRVFKPECYDLLKEAGFDVAKEEAK